MHLVHLSVLVDDGLHDGGFEVAAHRVRWFLDQQQANQLFLAIHPELRPERAVPREAASRTPCVRLNRIDLVRWRTAPGTREKNAC